MSYEPLHHKYRPKSFAELVGQEAIATTLTNAIRTAKIAPAYLFTGPRGTGKTSSARILAKSLNCLKSDKPTAEPCGICDVCQGITKGYSLDVIEIDAASNTGVDNIRELIEKAQFAPVQCRYKVYVVDECHMLSTQAFNALLKTLEEPPKHVVFVLATTDPQRVLPTIISRCQRFDFRRIQLEAMVKHLSAIASKENIQIALDAVTLIGQIAQGGLRDAESLLDQLALLSGEVTPDKVWDLVGSVSEKDLLALLNAIAQDNPEAVLDCSRNILDRGREPLIILQNFAACYRDLLIAKTAPSRHDLVACTSQTWTALVEFAKQFDVSTILAGQQHLRAAEVQIKNTTQPRLWLEVTLLGLLPSANIQPTATGVSPRLTAPSSNHRPSPPPQYPAEKAASSTSPSQPNHNESRREGTSSPSASSVNHTFSSHNSVSPPPAENGSTPQPPVEEKPFVVPTQHISPELPPEEVSEVKHSDLTQDWQKVLANLQPISRRELLRQMCFLMEFDGTAACVGVKSVWYDKVKSDLPMITAAFQKTFGREVQVSLEKGTLSNSAVPRKDPPKNGSSNIQQPSPSGYNNQNQPSTPTPPPQPTSIPAPAPTPLPPPAKTESVARNGSGIQTLTPPPTRTLPNDWETDEVAIAAQRLAQFFDGQIIRLTEDVTETSESISTSEWTDESETDDE
ncbi:DNA polymerase III subunit gamma/tau [Nostocaceae cyanobacterium CENA357]|uniref:DNA polymerase III subunit gamma/tau n=1 Tax=Atlanticothrix silvestris CENA357 TaxID=1725252 RepID=A0A8J7HMC1_9CYAN|nr:DNA polymerase III subunit gamma/tau [Atlanticothrix silvestris]MBH8555814.1 DNA polymerase III subunit gamma/tau [Atlanticothrix silvestris CENA357]